MQINLIFARSFWWDRENIFDGSTTKFNSYIEKRVQTKIGAFIQPVTILMLSDLTIQRIEHFVQSMKLYFDNKTWTLQDL